MSRVAVIAGGAGGLGRALGAGLRARGFHVVALDLPSAELEGLVADGNADETVACDMTEPAALETACASITTRFPVVDLVIYAQGVTHLAEFEDDQEPQHRRVFDVNYFASVSLARHMLVPVRQARGTHLAISSVAGFAPLVRRTAYAASKHALEGFFKSLRCEEAPKNVRVLIAAPSFVATNLEAKEGSIDGLTRPGASADGIGYMSAEDAAAVILKGYEAHHNTILVGRIARLASWVVRIWPAFYDRQMMKRIGKN